MVLRARVATALTFIVTFPLVLAAARTRPLTAGHPWLTALAGASAAACLTYLVLHRLPEAAGAGALAVTAATGTSTPYVAQFSREESLAARGDVAGALAAYEQVIAEHPHAIPPRMRAAELYATRGGNPLRAAELFREIRSVPGVTNRDAVYACSRLVDLYDGALDDPGRALVELRRIVELYPGTPVAAHARAALPRLKARLAGPTA
ncbi:MAG: hypothetical protein JWL60_1935 [Gemmatimonadetes bacterium]|jgi:hypothetical protein|nr:hypothetical protein [Gemmatimonadota bacterium]